MKRWSWVGVLPSAAVIVCCLVSVMGCVSPRVGQPDPTPTPVPRPSQPPPPPPPPPLPTPTPAALRLVPDVRGLTQGPTIEALREAGIEFEVRFVEVADAPEGTVIDQDPPPGTRIPPGVRIILTVNAAALSIDPPLNGDEDEDGVPDEVDQCTGTPPGTDVDEVGCKVAEVLPVPTAVTSASYGDEDDDGVPDLDDRCQETIVGASVDLSGCSDRQNIDLLQEGIYAFNSPDEMVVGKQSSYLVVLILEPEATVANEEVERAVTIVLERASPDQRDDLIEVHRRPYSGRMSAELTGPPGWDIQPLSGSKGIRIVDSTEKTTWKWDVYPACSEPSLSLECEEARLTLAVMAHFGDASQPWPLLEETIVVKITLAKVVRGFLADNWQWVWTAILLPVLGLLVRWWRAKKKQQPTVKILALSANPGDTRPLQLDEELRAIDAAIQKAKYREHFDLKQHWAVRSTELDDFLLRHRPHIVHFSGHGSEASELLLERPNASPEAPPVADRSQPVPPETLGRLFSALKDEVRLVVLNACYSEGQARAIAQHIDCVVGMSRAISDPAAISFAASFYLALAYGRTLQTAFDLACVEAGLTGEVAAGTAQLIADRVDPKSIVFITVDEK